MKYTNYQQGTSITIEGLKKHLRIPECEYTQDKELAILLKSATLYVQEYFNTALVECNVLQEQPQAGKDFKIFLSNQTNIQVKDYDGNAVAFERSGDFLTLPEVKAVKITYSCSPVDDVEYYAPIVYQIAGANYDGQPEAIKQILSNYPAY